MLHGIAMLLSWVIMFNAQPTTPYSAMMQPKQGNGRYDRMMQLMSNSLRDRARNASLAARYGYGGVAPGQLYPGQTNRAIPGQGTEPIGSETINPNYGNGMDYSGYGNPNYGNGSSGSWILDSMLNGVGPANDVPGLTTGGTGPFNGGAPGTGGLDYGVGSAGGMGYSGIGIRPGWGYGYGGGAAPATQDPTGGTTEPTNAYLNYNSAYGYGDSGAYLAAPNPNTDSGGYMMAPGSSAGTYDPRTGYWTSTNAAGQNQYYNWITGQWVTM